MRRYSETVKAEVKRRMGPPQRQSVAQISKEFGIYVATLYNCRHNWRLEGEVVPASAKDPEGWSPPLPEKLTPLRHDHFHHQGA
jgi:transposase-like protein